MNNHFKLKLKKYCKDNNLEINLEKSLNNLSNIIYKYSLISSAFAEHANRKIVNIKDYNITSQFIPFANNKLNFFNLFDTSNNIINKNMIKKNLYKDGKYNKEFINLLATDLNNNLDYFLIKK